MRNRYNTGDTDTWASAAMHRSSVPQAWWAHTPQPQAHTTPHTAHHVCRLPRSFAGILRWLHKPYCFMIQHALLPHQGSRQQQPLAHAASEESPAYSPTDNPCHHPNHAVRLSIKPQPRKVQCTHGEGVATLAGASMARSVAHN